MEWELLEEKIVVNFYLRHVSNWQNNMDEVMNEMKNAGYTSRDETSTHMRISNVSWLHTGIGLSNASKQTIETYKKMVTNLKKR